MRKLRLSTGELNRGKFRPSTGKLNGGSDFRAVFCRGNVLFHIISDKYISYLQNSEPHVMSNKEGARTYHRKYLGVLTKLNGFRYFIPLSSPKEKDYDKQGKIKADSDITIYIRNKAKLYGTLRLNSMVPVPDSELIKYDLNDEGDLRYKMLVLNELYFVRSNSRRIEQAAKELYERKFAQKLGKIPETHNLFLTLDFAHLETLCAAYRQG